MAESYSGTVSKEGVITIEGAVINRETKKGAIKKAGISLKNEVVDPFNPGASNIFIDKTVQILNEEMVAQLSFEGSLLKMVTLEPADLFNERNMSKLLPSSPNSGDIEAAYNRLKKQLDNLMEEKGELVEEDNVRYYIYERDDFGIMAVYDLNMNRASIVLAY